MLLGRADRHEQHSPTGPRRDLSCRGGAEAPASRELTPLAQLGKERAGRRARVEAKEPGRRPLVERAIQAKDALAGG